MKKNTWIVLLFFGLIIASQAQTSSKVETTSSNSEVKSTDNTLQASTVDITDRVPSVDNNATASIPPIILNQQDSQKKRRKKFKDRTLAGKILICAGVGAFAVLCLMYGTVSVGV